MQLVKSSTLLPCACCLSYELALCLQVKKAGALDASAVEDEEEMQSIARIRKPTWIAVGIIIFMGYIVWPLLTLPAGDFRYTCFQLCDIIEIA